MKPLLVVLNPRQIPTCIDAIETLDVDRLWMIAYTERELVAAIPAALEELDHDPIVFLSDDTIPTQGALEAVLDFHRGSSELVVTGFCNLDAESPFVNVTRRPFTGRRSTPDSYDFYTYDDVVHSPRPVRSWFAGLALTCLSRELLAQFPIRNGRERPSDFDLSLRLQAADVPIYAPPAAFVYHVKERWNLPDQAAEKQLLIGKVPQEARLDLEGDVAIG